jgi:hypothetical protein
VHDLFEILGLPTNAPAREVRRACARRPRRLHPDFHDTGTVVADPQNASLLAGLAGRSPADELDIDFVHASAFNDSILAAFFDDGGTT